MDSRGKSNKATPKGTQRAPGGHLSCGSVPPAIVLVLLLQMLGWPVMSADLRRESLEVAIHFQGGLSLRSHLATIADNHQDERLPEIRFLDRNTHFHVLLNNRFETPLLLWMPNCPDADRALTFEFKYSETSSVMRAKIMMDYTAGMGFPKAVTIAPRDALIIDVDFCNYWDFPFQIRAGGYLDLFMRVVYASEPTRSGSKQKLHDSVWTGRTESEWIKVRIVNMSKKTKPPVRRQ